MLSKTLALTQRGLRRDTRVIANHLLRLGILIVVAFSVFIAHISSLTAGAPGLHYFSSIAWTTLLFSTLAGATFFAATITEEKEEQTLGLLALANVRPAALIVGKFLPRLLSSLMFLTIVLPFTLLAITLGGVTWHQVWAAYWTLAAHVVFMGSIGLFFSVLCRTSGSAIAWSLLAMLAFFAGIPLLTVVAAQITANFGLTVLPPVAAVLAKLVEASAFVRINEILQTGFDQPAFGTQVVGNLGISALLLLLSWALFGLFNRDTEAAARAAPLFDRALRFRKGSRRSWRYALAWKDFHYVAGGTEWLLIRVLLYGIAVAATALISNGFQIGFNLRNAVSGSIVGVISIVVVFEATLLASRLFRSEIKDGTWETLVGLPYSVPSIAYGKLGGALISLAPAALFLLFAVGLVPDQIAVAVLSPGGSSGGLYAVVGSLAYIAPFLLFLHLTTLYSIIFNSWAGVLLAAGTMMVAQCFVWPLMVLPMVLVSLVTGSAPDAEWLGLLTMLVIYGGGFLAICFGLQVLIFQQLRAAAAR